MQSSRKFNALIIGVCLGIATFSVINSGFTATTLLLLLFAFIAFNRIEK